MWKILFLSYRHLSMVTDQNIPLAVKGSLLRISRRIDCIRYFILNIENQIPQLLKIESLFADIEFLKDLMDFRGYG